MSCNSKRKRIDEMAFMTAQKRSNTTKQIASITDEGWISVDTSRDGLFLRDCIKELPAGASLKFHKNSSAVDLFKSFISSKLIDESIERLSEEHPTWFTFNKGQGKLRNLQISSNNVYKALALRVWLHGPGRAASTGRSRKESLQKAL